ncbi:MAG: glycosyltransferase, partial [Gemmataceae bacterium]
RELVTQKDAIFPPGDPAALEKQLQRMTDEPGYRQDLYQRQAAVGPRFAEREVARRLWTHVTKHLRRSPAPAVRAADAGRPRLAILSPYPPDRSGVADYTAISLADVARHARVDVFTEAKSPRRDPWVHRYHDVSDLAYLQGEYDRILAVVGNSDFHWRILQLHKRYGGACLMHDNRLAELYAWKLGLGPFANMASEILGRGVSTQEAEHWLRHPGQLPALFFDEILLRADPLIVHSRGIQSQVAKRYKVKPAYLPFCCYRPIEAKDLTDDSRRAARKRLGVPDDRLLIISLGILSRVKGAAECIYAIEQLRTWGVPAELHFVGSPADMKPELSEIADKLGVGDHIRLMEDWTTEQQYQDYLLAADFAIQLRAHGFGGLSGAVMDCITAGLPTVVNEDLAEAMDGPDYVYRVPDHFSPLLIAEQILLASKAERHRVRLGPTRDAYLREHSFDRYARLMMKVLGVAA